MSKVLSTMQPYKMWPWGYSHEDYALKTYDSASSRVVFLA